MTRKLGQIIRRGSSTWLVRIYFGRDPQTRRRGYIGKFIHGRLCGVLRRELLQPRDIGICVNTQCRALFEIERAGQQYCVNSAPVTSANGNTGKITGRPLDEKDWVPESQVETPNIVWPSFQVEAGFCPMINISAARMAWPMNNSPA